MSWCGAWASQRQCKTNSLHGWHVMASPLQRPRLARPAYQIYLNQSLLHDLGQLLGKTEKTFMKKAFP
jgi:hypothetical protein